MKEYLFPFNDNDLRRLDHLNFFKDYVRTHIYMLESYEERRIEFPLKMISIIIDAPDGLIYLINKFYETLLIYKCFRSKFNFGIKEYEKVYMNNIYENLRKIKYYSNSERWRTFEIIRKWLILDNSKVKSIPRLLLADYEKLPLVVIPGFKNPK